jgi:hypothetical protein
MQRFKAKPVPELLSADATTVRRVLLCSAFALFAFMPGGADSLLSGVSHDVHKEQPHKLEKYSLLKRMQPTYRAARGFGFGFGGGSRSRGAAPSSGGGGGGSYDVAARIAALRADAIDGARLSDGTYDATNAPNGLQLPTAPNLSSPSEVTYSSVSTLNTGVANGVTNRRATLEPGVYVGTGLVIGGQDIEVIVSGCTITPADDESLSLTVQSTAARWKLTGSSTTFRNGYYLGNCVDGHVYNVSFIGLAENVTNEIDNQYERDANGGSLYGHRLLFERVYSELAGGCFFSGATTGSAKSTNLLAMNCEFVVPAINNTPAYQASPQNPGPVWHENPVRFTNTNFGAVIDCRLWADHKHTFRGHDTCGTVIYWNIQSERGGAYFEPTGGSWQTKIIVIRDWRWYRESGLSGGGGLSVPYTGATPSNEFLSMHDCIEYTDEDGSPGATFNPTGGGAPHVSWSLSNNVFAAYVAAPAWAFYTTTPT